MSTNGGEISVKFSSQEESRLWQNFTRLVVEGRKVALGLQEASESAVKFEKGLDKFSEQVKRIDAGPIGGLREEMRKLDAAVKVGLLTEEQASAGRIEAQRRYQAELRKTREERQRIGAVDPLDVSGDPSKTTADKIEAGPLREYQAAMERLRATREKLAMDDATYAAASQAHYAEYIRQAKEIEAADRRVADQRKEAAGVKIDRERDAFSSQADKVRKQDSTPEERLKNRLDELTQAQQRLGVSQQDFETLSKAAHDQYQRELAESTAAINKAKAALDAERDSFTRQAEQIRRIDATPIERLKMRLDELRDAQKRVGMSQQDFETLSKKAHDQYQLEVRQSVAETERLKREAVETAQRSGSSFGEMSLGAMAAWTSVGATVIGVLNKVRQASEEAGQALKSAAPSRGTLAQLALDDPAKYLEMSAQADSLRAKGVTTSLEEANQFMLAMHSANAGDEIDVFSRAKRVGLIQDPSSMIASAAGIRESFGADAGSIQDLVNRSLVASASSPAKAEELLRGAGKAGVAAKQQGISVDELLSLTAIMATAKGGADEGGTRVAALLSALAVSEPERDSRGRVKKDSFLQESLRGRSVEDIAADEKFRTATPAQLQRALGSKEAVETLGVAMEQIAKLRDQTPRIRRGVEENKLETGISIVEADPRVMAAVNLRAQQGAQEVERLNRGQASLEVDAMLIEGQRQVEQAPQAGFLRRLFNATPVGVGSNLMQGDLSSAISGFSLPTAMMGNAAKSEAGLMVAGGLRTGLEAVGGDAVFLDVMRRIGLGGDKQAASADKLADAADKLTAAADRLGTLTPGPRAVNRTGPARLEAAGAN